MNTKPIPIIITLAAAFISCVVSILQRVEFSVFVTRLLIVVLIFLFMGTVIKIVLDYSFKTLEPPVSIDSDTPDIDALDFDDEESSEEENEDILPESEEGFMN